MTIYLILFIILFGLYFRFRHVRDVEKAKKTLICTMTIALSGFAGLRNLGTGVDTYDYYMSYENIALSSWSELFQNFVGYFNGTFFFDPGYTLFVKVVQIFCPSFYVFNFIVALILISAIGTLIYKSVETLAGCTISYSFYISLLYHNIPNNLIRQSLAIGLLIWAMLAFMKQKKLLAISFFVVAVFFHKSALIGIVPFFFVYFKHYSLVFFSAILLTPLMFIYGENVVNILVLASANERYLNYMDASTTARPIMYILEMLIFYLMGFGFLTKIKFATALQRLSFSCFAMAVVFSSMLWLSSDLIRIGMYFSIWGVVYIPYCLNHLNPRLKTIGYIISFLLLVGRPIIQPTPYNFFWEKVELHDRYNHL